LDRTLSKFEVLMRRDEISQPPNADRKHVG
jgi:hypothetical protein